MNEFLRFIEQLVKNFPVHLEITYNKTCDWQIYVYKRGCAEDYPKSKCVEADAILCDVQDGDMELCFARAQIALKEWLADNCGGY